MNGQLHPEAAKVREVQDTPSETLKERLQSVLLSVGVITEVAKQGVKKRPTK